MTHNVTQLIAREGLKVVIGLGKTGLSCVRYLKGKGYQVAVVDSRDEPPGAKELASEFSDVVLYSGSLEQEVIFQAEELIVSPGVTIKQEPFISAAEKGIQLIGDVELFCREITQPIIAITGSNAKSTVTDLLGTMAASTGIKVAVGGNIGTPVLDLLAEERAELYVLELSSFQLETTHSLRAAAATVLNVSEDHMDRYEGIPDYRLAKHRIYRGCQTAVFNRQDALTAPLVGVDVKQVSFGLNRPDLKQWGIIQEDGNVFLAKGLEKIIDVEELRIRGSHNHANALAALALGEAAGLDIEAMLTALKQYQGLPHRCQWVREINGVNWYNDSKGTNVGATVAALEGLKSGESANIIVIAGGVGKGADFSPLSSALKKSTKRMILFGEDKQTIAAAVGDATEIDLVTDLAAAVELAHQHAQVNDVVLFSPACASFDMFKNYEERGDIFCSYVAKIG